MAINSIYNNPYQNAYQRTGQASQRNSIVKEEVKPFFAGASQEQLDRVNQRMEGLNAAISGTAQPPDSVEGYNDRFQDKIAAALNKLGITLGEDEVLEVSIGADKLIQVSGLADEEKAKALAQLLNTANVVSVSGKAASYTEQKNLDTKTFYLNSDYAKAAGSFEEASFRAMLIDLKDKAADSIKKQTGADLDIGSLSKDENGNITGYPKELAWIFEGDYSLAPKTDAEKQQYATAKSVLHTVNLLLDAGYHNIPNASDIGVSFRYTQDSFGSSNTPGLDTQA